MARKNSKSDTQRYAVAVYNQTSLDNGNMNENVVGFSFFGAAKSILIPINKQISFQLN